MKFPSIQFYPGDWRKDPGVQSLSFEERGIWLEILFMMHESERPGRLMIGGSPYPVDRLARVMGLSPSYLEVIITDLITLGVASRCEETGALMNRRMVRDRQGAEKLTETRSESGKKGGNPNFKKGKSNPYYDKQTDKQKDKQNITPSSSSSSSSSDIPPNPQGGTDEDEEKKSTKPLEILPDGWKKLGKTEQGRKKVNFNDLTMIRIGKFLGQRETTLWTIAEYVALQDVNPSDDDLDLIGQHYSFEIENNGYRYKDIYTLLNNWPKARTRAEAYFQEFPDHRAA